MKNHAFIGELDTNSGSEALPGAAGLSDPDYANAGEKCPWAWFGVFGAPGLTLAAEAVALSLVSGFIANAAARRAVEELKKAQALYEGMIANDGAFVDVDRIAKIELPLPHLWRAKRGDGDVYLHSGDDFVAVASPQGQFLINWRDVSAIQFSSDAETARAAASTCHYMT